MIEEEPVAESSRRTETFVDVAPSLKDLGQDKAKKEKVCLPTPQQDLNNGLKS